MSGTGPLARAWPHLRAAFVVFHVAVVVGMSVPAPEGGMNRSAWEDPTVQAELKAWAARFRALGMAADDTTFQSHLWDFAAAFMDARRAVFAPLGFYTERLGVRQSWRMFVAPQRVPARLNVEIEEDGEWSIIFREVDPEATWMEPVLAHDRMRSLLFRFSWKSYRKAYGHLADHLARRAAADFPEATRARIYWERYRTLSPEATAAGVVPSTKVEGLREYRLGDLR
jgi:hypothetical protein